MLSVRPAGASSNPIWSLRIWLGNMATFERILPRRASVGTAIRRHRTPRSPTDENPAAILSRLNRNNVQARDQSKVPDIGCSHSITEFQRTHPD